jgi:hypothetical protein
MAGSPFVWFGIGFTVALLLASTPPTSTLLSYVAQQVNPIAGLVHVQLTFTGAHSSLIATAALKLGAFNALHNISARDDINEDGETFLASVNFVIARSVGDPWFIPRRVLQLPTGCATPSQLASSITFARVDDSAALLDALASFGLVEVSVPWWTWAFLTKGADGTEPCYRNTIATELFAVGTTSIADMARVSNHQEIIHRLVQLDKTLAGASTTTSKALDNTVQQQQDEEGRLPAREEDGFHGDLGDLWSTYASFSGAFTSRVASTVASQLRATSTATTERWVLDVGAGSGEFSEALLKAGGADRAVLVDFQGPLDVAKRRIGDGLDMSKLTFIAGSAFDARVVESICHALRGFVVASQPRDVEVTLMMNSFAQHFEATHILEFTNRLALCMQSTVFAPVEGRRTRFARFRVAITELVRPTGPYSMLWEPVPLARTFHFVLRAFTKGGEMRSKEFYESLAQLILDSVQARAERDRADHSAEAAAVTTASLTPMPAVLVLGVVDLH